MAAFLAIRSPQKTGQKKKEEKKNQKTNKLLPKILGEFTSGHKALMPGTLDHFKFWTQ